MMKKIIAAVSAAAMCMTAAVPALAADKPEAGQSTKADGEETVVDYRIYYDAESGFRKNKKEGEPLTADEIPEGLSAEGDTITLNNVSFATTQSVAFSAEGDITLNIPENSRTVISVNNSDPVASEDPEESNVVGVQLVGNSVIQADGELSVTAQGPGRTFGMTSYGNLTIKGKGDVTVTEALGADGSWALMSTDDLTIEDSVHVNAYAYSLNEGIDYDIISIMSRRLNVKDDAVLDTSGGSNAIGIGIWDGYDIVTEDSASIIAYGGINLFGNEEKKPGAIHASGNSTINVKCEHNGDGDSSLDWGIIGAPYGGSDAPADEIALVYVTDNARVSVYTAAENGGAVGKVKAAEGVKVTGGKTEGDKGALEYNGDTYVLPGTEDNARYVLFEPTGSGSCGGTADPTMHPAGFAYEGKVWFKDVPSDAWYYDAVKQVYEKGLMNGIDLADSEFAPDMTLTRGMLAVILGRMDGVQSTDTATEYTDVSPDAYYAPYVAWGTENGILNGMGDGTFRPNDPVTREQAAKIIKAYYDYKGEGPTGAWAIRLDYSDLADISDWAVEGVMFCTMQGIMTGRENGTFDPKANITRAECAAVIVRIK